MLRPVSSIFNFLKFYFAAQTRYQVHSPFIFDFCENVLDDERHFYAFSEIGQLKTLLLKDKKMLTVEDLGAGSKVFAGNQRKVSDLAKNSPTPTFFQHLLFKMTAHFHAKNVLELGTSLGLTTIFLSKAALKGKIITIEGSESIAGYANLNFKRMACANVALKKGRFEEQLAPVIAELKSLDLVFFDGNHQKQATLRYFEQCLSAAHENSVFVFDDIYWSKGMQEAWETIQNHPAVTQTIDLFQFGIVFFQKDFKTKKHWKLAPVRWKPWQVW